MLMAAETYSFHPYVHMPRLQGLTRFSDAISLDCPRITDKMGKLF